MLKYKIDKLPDKTVKKIIFTKEYGREPNDKKINDKEYILEEDYGLIYQYSKKEKYLVVCKKGFVYNGFSTDFLGIPRMLQGKHTGAICAALMHDADYCIHFSRNRSNADWNLLLTCKAYGYYWITRNLIYTGVKIGGWAVYGKKEKELILNMKYIEIWRMK